MRCRLSIWWDIISGIAVTILVTGCKHTLFFFSCSGCTLCSMWSAKPHEVGVWSALMPYQIEHLCVVCFFHCLQTLNNTALHVRNPGQMSNLTLQGIACYSPYFRKLLWCVCVRVHVHLSMGGCVCFSNIYIHVHNTNIADMNAVLVLYL